MTSSDQHSSNLSAAAAQILDFLCREGNKQHSADELTALLSLEQGQVDQGLAELQAAGLATPEVVTGYGGSATMWGLSAG
ncbi:MarR family transcriptional regulator [Deinococcus oregonensis]|uniref:MarR family transcriptional regulator n=1 Tax=Deinococcus oregonensis TaxID=1805970 RepID=A0ABV6AYC2_9DEIO